MVDLPAMTFAARAAVALPSMTAIDFASAAAVAALAAATVAAAAAVAAATVAAKCDG